jgi:predicted outer membrane protein
MRPVFFARTTWHGPQATEGAGQTSTSNYADRLAKLSGTQFDGAYMNAMVKDHRKDVAAFKKQMQASKGSRARSVGRPDVANAGGTLRLAENLTAHAKGGAPQVTRKGPSVAAETAQPD